VNESEVLLGEPRRMHGKLTLLISGACGGCLASSDTSLFSMQKFSSGPVSHFPLQPSNPGVSPFSGI